MYIADPGPLPQILSIFAAQGRRAKTRKGINYTRGIKKAHFCLPWKQPKYFQSTHTYLVTFKEFSICPKATSGILNQNLPDWSVFHSSAIVKRFLVALPVGPSSQRNTSLLILEEKEGFYSDAKSGSMHLYRIDIN